MPYEWLLPAFGVLAKRGIEPYEVLQVLYSIRRRPVLVRHPRGMMLLSIWGSTRAGRALVVMVRPAGGFDHQILGAREMTDDERREYDQWLST